MILDIIQQGIINLIGLSNVLSHLLNFFLAGGDIPDVVLLIFADKGSDAKLTFQY